MALRTVIGGAVLTGRGFVQEQYHANLIKFSLYYFQIYN